MKILMALFTRPVGLKGMIYVAIIISALGISVIGVANAFADSEIEDYPRVDGAEDEHHKNVGADAIKTKIHSAVANGDLTQEEADEKLAILEERFEHGLGKGFRKRHGGRHVGVDAIKAKIQSAVANGDLTQSVK